MARPSGGYRQKSTEEHPKGKRVPGASTLCKIGEDGGGLMYWAWQQGLEGLDFRATGQAAADSGTMAHRMIELHCHGVPRKTWYQDPELRQLVILAGGKDDPKVKLAWKAFFEAERWLITSKLKIVDTEVSYTSEKHEYGGTRDGLARLPRVGTQTENGTTPVNEDIAALGSLVLLDWKTGNGLYPSMLKQLAAYCLLHEEFNPDDHIDEIHLLRFGKQHADFHHHSWRRDSDLVVAAEKAFLLAVAMDPLNKLLKKGVK